MAGFVSLSDCVVDDEVELALGELELEKRVLR